MVRLTVFVAAIYGALGVLFGAYRAHGLEKALLAAELSASQIAVRLDNLSVAVQYDLIHAVVLLSLATLQLQSRSKFLTLAAIFFALGIFFFSGSLALWAITGQWVHPLLPPSGGLLLIAGWIVLAAYAACRQRVQETQIPVSL